MKKMILLFIASVVISSAQADSGRLRLNRITAYTPSDSSTRASCGTVRGDGIAVSRDLFYKNGKKRCGELVQISYKVNGRTVTRKKVIWDTMNSRYYRAADIFMYSSSDARKFGVKTGTIKFLN